MYHTNSLLRILVFAAVVGVAVATQTPAQTIPMYLQQVANGWPTDAKKALPDLLLDRPDDAGVTFLHASLVEDPAKAIPLYERIVERFPQNEWADDALLRLIIQAASQKDATRATKYFKQLRQVYGKSDLLPIAYDVLRMSVGVPPPDLPTSTTATKPAEPVVSTTPAETAPDSLPYTLVALTTPDKAVAQKQASQYKAKHLKADVAEKWIKGKRNYVVQIGRYASEIEAAADIASVRTVCKCKPIVSKRMP